jgi:hypothetical protein
MDARSPSICKQRILRRVEERLRIVKLIDAVDDRLGTAKRQLRRGRPDWTSSMEIEDERGTSLRTYFDMETTFFARPFSQATTFDIAVWSNLERDSRVAHAMCGVTMQFLAPINGE